MVVMKPAKARYVKRHDDGSVWAQGTTVEGVPDGYFEWFRKDGTKMRSGHFKDGKQAGEWTTFDRKGRIVKTTRFDLSSLGPHAEKK
jgi:antitoxin component YwqK of YwqJK toxin-antitoxin module